MSFRVVSRAAAALLRPQPRFPINAAAAAEPHKVCGAVWLERQVQMNFPDPRELGARDIVLPTGEALDKLECVKRTYRPSVLRRKRKHGFMKRIQSKDGRKVNKRRQDKGRWYVSIGR